MVHIFGQDRKPPEQVKLTRDISSNEALSMITKQQSQLVRMLLALSEVENRMHRSDERNMKMLNMLAATKAKLKNATQMCDRLGDVANERTVEANVANQQVTFLARIVTILADRLYGVKNEITLNFSKEDYDNDLGYEVHIKMDATGAAITFKPESETKECQE